MSLEETALVHSLSTLSLDSVSSFALRTDRIPFPVVYLFIYLGPSAIMSVDIIIGLNGFHLKWWHTHALHCSLSTCSADPFAPVSPFSHHKEKLMWQLKIILPDLIRPLTNGAPGTGQDLAGFHFTESHCTTWSWPSARAIRL